jgi:hypothetical protein
MLSQYVAKLSQIIFNHNSKVSVLVKMLITEMSEEEVKYFSHEQIKFRPHDRNFDLMKKLNFDLMKFNLMIISHYKLQFMLSQYVAKLPQIIFESLG